MCCPSDSVLHLNKVWEVARDRLKWNGKTGFVLVGFRTC